MLALVLLYSWGNMYTTAHQMQSMQIWPRSRRILLPYLLWIRCNVSLIKVPIFEVVHPVGRGPNWGKMHWNRFEDWHVVQVEMLIKWNVMEIMESKAIMSLNMHNCYHQKSAL